MTLRWPWQERKPSGIEERTSAIRAGAARVTDPGCYVRAGVRAEIAAKLRQEDIDYLIAVTKANEPIRDMAKSAGWAEYERALRDIAERKLRALPSNVLKHGATDPQVLWDAAVCDIINTVLLGIVSNALYESANLERLINTKLAAQSRLNREEHSNAR